MERRETLAGPIAAVVLAACSAVCLAAADAVAVTNESLFVLGVVLGWALLAWAAGVAGVCAVLLVSRAASRRPVSRLGLALVVVALAAVAVLLGAHPLWGSGSASA